MVLDIKIETWKSYVKVFLSIIILLGFIHMCRDIRKYKYLYYLVNTLWKYILSGFDLILQIFLFFIKNMIKLTRHH
jgi:hypothetical protein